MKRNKIDDLQKIELSLKEKKEFFNSFYFLYSSGHPVMDVFQLIMTSSSNVKIKFICKKILRKIQKGYSLKESLSEVAAILGYAYTMLIVAGESSGKLDDILKNITKNISREENLRSTIIQESIYPVIMLIFAIFVFLLFKLFIMKIFKMAIEGDMPSDIPAMLFGAIFQIIMIFILFTFIIIALFKNKQILNTIKDFAFKSKVLNNFVKSYLFINFFSVLSLAYEAGITVAESVILANSIIKIKDLNRRINKSQKMIETGSNVTTAFIACGIFPDNVISQIATGEKSGELGKMFANISNVYEKKLELIFSIIKKALAPIMLVIVGISVGYVAYMGYSEYYKSLLGMF